MGETTNKAKEKMKKAASQSFDKTIDKTSQVGQQWLNEKIEAELPQLLDKLSAYFKNLFSRKSIDPDQIREEIKQELEEELRKYYQEQYDQMVEDFVNHPPNEITLKILNSYGQGRNNTIALMILALQDYGFTIHQGYDVFLKIYQYETEFRSLTNQIQPDHENLKPYLDKKQQELDEKYGTSYYEQQKERSKRIRERRERRNQSDIQNEDK